MREEREDEGLRTLHGKRKEEEERTRRGEREGGKEGPSMR